MTNEGRITALEAALAHEREEREALAKLLVSDQVGVRRDIETLRLTADFIDERIEQLKQRTGGGNDAEIFLLISDCLKQLQDTIMAVTNALADRIGTLESLARRQVDAATKANDVSALIADSLTPLTARVERIETLIAPVLRGEAKLLAQEVVPYRGFTPCDDPV